MDQLIPCTSCNRHVLATEQTCPFCSTVLVGGAPAPRAPTGRGLTRAAILFAGATAVSACGTPEPNPVPMYGPASVDSGQDASDAGTSDVAAPDAGND